jgi:flagellar biosynthesis GTPase FlhF
MALTLKEYEADLKKKKGGRLYGSKVVSTVLLDKDYDEYWDPSRDLTLQEYQDQKREEELRGRGLHAGARPFVPSFKLKSRKSRKTSRKARKSLRKSRKTSRKVSRKTRKSLRKSRKVSRKTRKSLRKSRKTSRKARKSLRKSRKVSRKVSRKARKSLRKSRKVSRKTRKSLRKSRKASRKSMGRRERVCKDLLKEKVGINLKEYRDGRYVSRQQAIAVAYNQVKNMTPSCGKYFKRK